MESNRREFFEALGAGAAGLAIGTSAISSSSCAPQPSAPKAEEDGPVLRVGDNIALADTSYGKVRGYILRDIHYFLGIPYGADTSGASRFMPPQKPKPWTDVYPALWWGNSAPQNMENRYANKYASFRDCWNYDDVSEDCLRINVFTPAINDDQKRPVMFWIHGGGFAAGNGIEQHGYAARTWRDSGTWSSAPSTIGWARSASPTSPAWVARSSPPRATSACSTSSPPSSGCATTSPGSAATLET
jgi:para-nitrobenzyl esterase